MLEPKRYVNLLCLLLFGGIAFAQSGYVYTAEFPNISTQASRSIFVCSDNSVVVLGNADDTNEFHFHYLTITKLSPQGVLLWRQWMDGGVSITGVDIDANDTVTFITTAQYIRLWAVDSDGTLYFLSEGMDVLNHNITFNKAMRTPNNEIVAVGKRNYNYDVSSACYYRFSATGDTLATALWPVDQGSQYLEAEAYDLALKDNGNVLVTCMLHTSLGSVLEITPAGNLLTRLDLPCLSVSIGTIPIIRENNLQSFLISISTGDYPNDITILYRLSDGVFYHLFTIDVDFVYSMVHATDSVYLCGLNLSPIPGVLVKFGYNGLIQWSWNQQGVNTSDYITDGFGSPSTALLGLDPSGCVYWAWGNLRQQVIIKLLPNGQVPVEDEVQTPQVSKMLAYPNPMKGRLHITFPLDDLLKSNENIIEIFNIKGQLVRTVQLRSGESEWDGKDILGNPCSNGIYLLRPANGKTHTTKICKTN